MTLQERIDADLREALKARQDIRVSTLRMVKAEVKNLIIDKREEKAEDKDVISVISKQIKQHYDSIEAFAKGNRQDLVNKEKAELAILESYMPKRLTAEELKAVIKSSMEKVGAKGRSDMGKVMKAVMDEAAGKADGKELSRLVSEELAKLG
ncbi:MAG: GatB/YqeY domain-containing protein [Candidatus Omnitrophota bacterium]